MKTAIRGILICAILALCLSTSFASESNPRPSEKEIRAIIELLVSPQASEVKSGEQLLAAQRSAVFEILLDRIRTGDLVDQRIAAYQLGLAISPWMRGKETGERSYGASSFSKPRRPVDRQPELAEGKAIRSVLQQTIARLLARKTNDLKEGHLKEVALKALAETLLEVANDDTIDWIADQLSRTDSPSQTEYLIGLADDCLGLPREYFPTLFCGNMSAAGAEAAERYQESEASVARKKFAENWPHLRKMNGKQRINYAIAKWSKFFAAGEKNDPDEDNALMDWYFLQLEPLVRLGTPALPALRAHQAWQRTLKMKAMWEVPIATITGKEDETMVRKLLAGNGIEAALACEIIVAADSKRWLPELDALQKRKDFSRKRASDAIASCFGAEGIPALKRGFAADKENYSAEYSLQELAQWKKRGFPKEMRRYEYRKTE